MAELAAGGGPDVLHDTTYDQVRPGYCLDLTDHIKPWGDRFYPEALAQCTWDGRVYSLPTEYSMVPCIWSTSLLKRIGRPIPSTFEVCWRPRISEAIRSVAGGTSCRYQVLM